MPRYAISASQSFPLEGDRTDPVSACERFHYDEDSVLGAADAVLGVSFQNTLTENNIWRVDHSKDCGHDNHDSSGNDELRQDLDGVLEYLNSVDGAMQASIQKNARSDSSLADLIMKENSGMLEQVRKKGKESLTETDEKKELDDVLRDRTNNAQYHPSENTRTRNHVKQSKLPYPSMPPPLSTDNTHFEIKPDPASTTTTVKAKAKLNALHESNKMSDRVWPVELLSLLQTSEDILKDSEQQRESARNWALGMRESVRKWVNEQRTLIECERHRASAEYQNQEAATSARHQTQENMVRELHDTVQSLQSQIQADAFKHEEIESRLYEIVQQHENKVEQLEELLRLRQKNYDINSVTASARLYDNTNRKSPTQRSQRALSINDDVFSHERKDFLRLSSRNLPDKSIASAKYEKPPLLEQRKVDTPPRRVEVTSPDGTRVVRYRNGSQKEVLLDGKKIFRFANGDIKTHFAGNEVVSYYYASTMTTHTIKENGIESYEYPNKHVEKHYPDGRKKIHFSDGTVKKIFPDGATETIFPDCVRLVEFADGTKEITRF